MPKSFVFDHRVRHSAERIATEAVVVPLLWRELCANPLIQSETGNVPIVGAQKRTFGVNNEMLKRRKRERHRAAAFEIDAVEPAIDFAADLCGRLLDRNEIVGHVDDAANGARAVQESSPDRARLRCFG